MSATFEPSRTASSVNKPLWAAVGVLGIAVLAMGATLIRMQTRHEEPRPAMLAATAPASTQAVSVPSAPLPQSLPAAALPTDSSKGSRSNKNAAPANHAPAATKTVANKAYQPAPAVYQPTIQVARPVCSNCGTVQSVTPIQRDGTAGGVGAVAGGVLGAVVGNQVGGGNGKTLATILGAVGGGIAGNTVEKKMKKETVYQVQVHMEDGSTRTFEQATPTAVGAKVVVEGNALQTAGR